ncbi:MAG: hypothetical protein ACFCUL_01100 [Flavobacteriaceae bacterium]
MVADQDTTFNERRYGEEFAKRINDGVAPISGFSTNDDATKALRPALLLEVSMNVSTHYLRNAKTNTTLMLVGYALYGAGLIFFFTKAFYEQLQGHGLSPAFERTRLSGEAI